MEAPNIPGRWKDDICFRESRQGFDDPDVQYVPHGFNPEDFLNHYSLDRYRYKAEEGDPTAIIEAFIRAHHYRCYPRWLLDHISKAFEAYSYGKKGKP